jgi:hypothetical protein
MSWRRTKPGIKVRELIEHLQKGDLDAEVVAFGHFGEAHGMDIEDFSFVDVRCNPQGHKGWYLSVTPVDIGPEPE